MNLQTFKVKIYNKEENIIIPTTLIMDMDKYSKETVKLSLTKTYIRNTENRERELYRVELYNSHLNESEILYSSIYYEEVFSFYLSFVSKLKLVILNPEFILPLQKPGTNLIAFNRDNFKNIKSYQTDSYEKTLVNYNIVVTFNNFVNRYVLNSEEDCDNYVRILTSLLERP